MPLVTVEQSEAVAILTLNRPEAMNALSQALRAELAAAIVAANADPAVRVVVLTGAGERAFCAGVDLKELASKGLKAERAPGELDVAQALAACAKPVIGAVNGVAITGGFELALACDILIASENARFADTHVRVGINPGWGLSQRLSRRIGLSRAKEMSLTGNFIDARTALAWGLVNRVTAPGVLMAAARRLAADIASCDPYMVARYKALIDDGYAVAFAEAMQLEAARSRETLETLEVSEVAARSEAIQARGRAQQG